VPSDPARRAVGLTSMPKTVLVVDDEALIALDIQSQLEDAGHAAFVANNLQAALDLMQRERFDVAIVDWHLKDEISAPLIDMLQQRQVPFILCSGSALDELAGLFPASPMLTKPFASDDLLGALHQLSEHTSILMRPKTHSSDNA